MSNAENEPSRSIKAIDALSTHRITSGQVVVDLQTAVKELVENSLDAGASNIEVRFKEYGVESVEVIDNGSGINSADYDAVGLKHHTSKLSSFEDLESVSTFGFRGEALSSLCALCGSVIITTATEQDTPMGTILELDKLGRVYNRNGKVARQKGTTVSISELFKPLPVRRKELERNAKREFGKALNLLTAYALVPCAKENGGIRLTCTQQSKGGRKAVQLRTDGVTSIRASVSALWGSKAGDNLVDLDLAFEVETEKSVLRRQGLLPSDRRSNTVTVKGLISKFALNGGRSGTDRQFFCINGRPCNPSKVQRAFNDVYKTFNVAQSPVIIADFILPKDSLDINVSPDKRTIFIHSEENLVQALKTALDEQFASERSTYVVKDAQPQSSVTHSKQKVPPASTDVPTYGREEPPLFFDDSDGDELEGGEADGFGNPTLLVASDVPGLEGIVEPSLSEHSPAVQDNALKQPSPAKGIDREYPEMVASPYISRSGSSMPPDGDTTLSSTATQLSSSAILPVVQGSSSPVGNLQAACNLSTTRVRISSIKEIQAPRPGSSRQSKADGDQLVLSTTGTSWNLQLAKRGASESSSPPRPRKRQALETDAFGVTDSTAITKKSSSRDFRSKIVSYALPGSQIADRESMISEDSEPEEIEGLVPPVSMDSKQPRLSARAADASKREVPMEVDEPDFTVAQSNFKSDTTGISPRTSYVSEERLGDTGVTVSPYKDVSPPGEIDSPTPSHSADLGDIAAPEYVRTSPIETLTVLCDEGRLSRGWANMSLTSGLARDTTAPCSAISPEDDTSAAELLSRVIKKTDFDGMEIVGQFNLGFIIVRRRRASLSVEEGVAVANTNTTATDDLFIVDQHAADEKYNFESLQANTKIDSQPLLRPKTLELTAADELLAMENIEVLRRNGFEIEVDESASSCGRRLKLVAQPVSKATVFDIRDLEELLHILRDAPPGQMVRCSKARSMFAMRACRMSIMVGMPLKHTQMTSVVRHMGTMDQPWNCPHGRPTMRHLADIVKTGRKVKEYKPLTWEGFVGGC